MRSTMKKLTDTFKLSNGVDIPCVGFGTWQMTDKKETENAIRCALETGYRHIDTAAAYENEKIVGEALQKSGLKREEIFVTSKLWNSNRGYETTLAAFEKTMKDLRLEYLDLYLIHWPAAAHQFSNWQHLNAETWRAFEKLYKEKRIRAIGVSNFLPHHLEPLMKTAEIKPMVDQIECHPGYMQVETVEFCRKNEILVEAWSPLGQGKVLENPELVKIAESYKKSTAQVCIRWCQQNGALPLPKSVTEKRIKENADVFNFELSDADMKTIDRLSNIGFSGQHPDKVPF